MAKKLSEAQKWAEGIRNCLSKAEHCSYQPDCDSDKVELAYVNELLGFDTVPCNEPGHLKLKVLCFYENCCFNCCFTDAGLGVSDEKLVSVIINII